MSPLTDHEEYTRFIERLVQVLSDELELTVQSYGSATWKRHGRAKGIEPDCCFYIRNASQVIGKQRLDLGSDPPPDIVFEIDTTRCSTRKFSIFAALEVPELWQYDGTTVRFYKLYNQSYLEIEQSQFILGLNPLMLSTALEQSKSQGQTEALHAFRRYFQHTDNHT